MALGALVITFTLAAFLGVLQNDFVNWDDPVNFLNNPSYRGLEFSQPKWMFTTFHMGRVLRDSVTLWSRAVALEPDNRFARINLGGAYAAAGRVPEAIDQYRQVLKLSPDKAPWYEVLGWLYASSGHVAEGLPLLLEALRLDPGRAGACPSAREAVRLLDLPPPPGLEACRQPG